MRILDILNSPWAISQTRLIEIQSIYRAHFRGEKIDWKAMEAKAGLFKVTPKEGTPYDIINGIAVIDISGVLTKSMSFFSFLFGGSSMQQIAQDYLDAIADPQVESVLLAIDSPGGTVDGTQELANIIYNGKNDKTVVAFSNGQICSAAYWVASAADKIYISGDTNHVGSIGIIGGHIDISKSDEMAGEKYTIISAGKYKNIADGHAPLSPEGRQTIQDTVDYMYSVFVNDVARNRNVSVEQVLKMANGKAFIGKQAIEVGLVDGVATYGQIINSMSAGESIIKAEEENQVMNITELKEKHPEVFQAAVDLGKTQANATMATQIETAKTDGIAAGAGIEKKRISEIMAQAVPGHEAIIDAAIADGKSDAGSVAMKIVAAERTLRAQKGKDAAADAAELTAVAVTAAAAIEAAKKKEETDFLAEVDKYQEEKKCKRSEAIKAIATAKPELHQKYLDSFAPGKK